MTTAKRPGRRKPVKGAEAVELSNCEVSGTKAQGGRTALVRRAMLNAAAELFAERGFGGTNLRDVADALGMSRPSLYYHFASKDKILEALMDEVTASAAQKLEEIVVEADRDPEDALRQVVLISAQWVLENPVLFRVLDRAEIEMPGELRQSHARAKRDILSHFSTIIERGVAAGKFRPVDTNIAALTIVGMRNWIAWWYDPNGRLDRQEIAATISEMTVRSLLRSDAHRSRSGQLSDAMRILKEDVAHLNHVCQE